MDEIDRKTSKKELRKIKPFSEEEFDIMMERSENRWPPIFDEIDALPDDERKKYVTEGPHGRNYNVLSYEQSVLFTPEELKAREESYDKIAKYFILATLIGVALSVLLLWYVHTHPALFNRAFSGFGWTY